VILHRAPIADVSRSGSRASGRRILLTSAATVLAGLVLVSCTSTSTPPPPTAKVERAALTTGVSATGALTAITEQNLGFAKGGQLTKVMVAVGQHVTAGQPLATIDPFPYQQALAQQKANLAQQQATLARLTNSPAVQGSQDSLAQAQKVVDATQNQADATAQADSVAVDRAHHQLDFDNDTLDQARQQQSDDENSCGDPSAMTASTNPACAAVAQDKAAVTAAEKAVVADKTAIDTAEQKQSVDQASGQLAVANAQQGVVTAQNNAASASSDRPFNLDAQSALVASAQAAVDQAQRDLDRTTLTAPVDGTISALNGAVGEFLPPSASITAQAPGSGAPIPGAGAASAALAGAAASPGRPGGTQFIVLDDIHQFQLVVPFGESDAAQIQPNQKVDITLDAVPDLMGAGTVVSVAPSGTAISGVISYYVTVAVDTVDPRLKDGQTAHAAVVTHETDNVLTVPNAAVHRDGGKSVVTVLGGDGTQQPVTFTPGIVGDQRTQVVSGLQEGQEIVLPAGQ
jgi:HlyD family secretion protein